VNVTDCPEVVFGLLDTSEVVVLTLAALTVWVTVFDAAEALNPEPPRYTAGNGVRADGERRSRERGDAAAVDRAGGELHAVVAEAHRPDRRAGPDAAVTVAVNVTDCPEMLFGLFDANAVLVLTVAALTVCVTVFDAAEALNPDVPR